MKEDSFASKLQDVTPLRDQATLSKLPATFQGLNASQSFLSTQNKISKQIIDRYINRSSKRFTKFYYTALISTEHLCPPDFKTNLCFK